VFWLEYSSTNLAKVLTQGKSGSWSLVCRSNAMRFCNVISGLVEKSWANDGRRAAPVAYATSDGIALFGEGFHRRTTADARGDRLLGLAAASSGALRHCFDGVRRLERLDPFGEFGNGRR
jgi:hypothetical protein